MRNAAGFGLGISGIAWIVVSAACGASPVNESEEIDFDAGRRDGNVDNPVERQDGGELDSGNTADVAAADAAKPGDSEVVVASQTNPRGVAVDDTFVYWANNGATASEKTVMKAPVGGGAAVKLGDGFSNPVVVGQDSTHVYVIELTPGDGAVKRIAKAGGTAQTLAPAAQALTVALDGSTVYFGTMDGRIRKVGKTGGTVADVAVGEGFMFGIAVDAQYVYFSTGITKGGPSPIPSTTEYAIKRVAVGGGTSTLVHEPTFKGAKLFGVALAGNYVLFSNEYEGAVKRVQVGGAPDILANKQTNPSHITTDGTKVYWINGLGTAKAGIGAGVVDNSVAGRVTAMDQSGAYGITNNATHVFWANRVEGTIRRMAK